MSRVSRAFYFLQSARATVFLPLKVAHYCTCFETLVSTSSTELAHQVAERVAVLISEDSQERMEVYRNLKRAYDTRSKVVHGSELTRSQQRYLDDSRNCDDYLRRLLLSFMAHHHLEEAANGPQEQWDTFFLGKLLSPTG